MMPPAKSTRTTGQTSQSTQTQLNLSGRPAERTSSAQDSLVRLSALRATGSALRTQEARYFLKSLGLQKTDVSPTYSLRTSKDCSTTTTGEPSKQSSERWMNAGLMLNGNVSTANIMYRRTENVSSLSAILETNPDPKYFLTERAVKSLMEHSNRHQAKGNGFGAHIVEQSMPTTIKEEERVQ